MAVDAGVEPGDESSLVSEVMGDQLVQSIPTVPEPSFPKIQFPDAIFTSYFECHKVFPRPYPTSVIEHE